MSKEQAQAFLEKVKNDEDLQKRLSDAQDKEKKLEIAKQEGYQFTEEEIKEVMSEMTDEELDNVSGGFVVSLAAGAVWAYTHREMIKEQWGHTKAHWCIGDKYER